MRRPLTASPSQNAVHTFIGTAALALENWIELGPTSIKNNASMKHKVPWEISRALDQHWFKCTMQSGG